MSGSFLGVLRAAGLCNRRRDVDASCLVRSTTDKCSTVQDAISETLTLVEPERVLSSLLCISAWYGKKANFRSQPEPPDADSSPLSR
jgi:hypothetical protein